MYWSVALWTVGIFLSRVVDVTLGTIRVQLIVRRRQYLAAAISFVEIVVYIVVVSKVIQEIGDHWYYVIAYGGGFAVGTIVGIQISKWMSGGIVEATVITQGPWGQIESAMREAGFALTRYTGVGREGRVGVLCTVCAAKNVSELLRIVGGVDPKAFVYTQELVGMRGGHIYGLKSKLS